MKLFYTMIFMLILLNTNVFAQNCTPVPIVTGFGYMTDSNGNVLHYNISNPTVDKSICVSQGLTYNEVSNQGALPALYVPPPSAAAQQEELIAEDEKNLAIQDLQSQGILTNAEVATAQESLITLQAAQTTAQATTGLGVKTGGSQANGT